MEKKTSTIPQERVDLTTTTKTVCLLRMIFIFISNFPNFIPQYKIETISQMILRDKNANDRC